MKNSKILFLTQAAVIAGLYVILTFFANSLGLASHAIQVRFSEALTVLPFFIPAAIPGLFAGCILSNILTGCLPLDVLFGSLATLIGALLTYLIGKKGLTKWFAPLPPILANTIIVPFILSYVYQFPGSIFYFMITVCLGEVLSCYILGMLLFSALYPRRDIPGLYK